MGGIEITLLDGLGMDRRFQELRDLLRDGVNHGASLGFLPPLSIEAAAAYWREVVGPVETGSRVLLGAVAEGRLVGAVQLDLCGRGNGLHRAEVMKLMVDSGVRRRGIGRRLMAALEEAARGLDRTLLVMDTRDGDPSCSLYESLGYTRAGVIPRYARSANGELHATAIYYKELAGDSSRASKYIR